jgi:formate hydrogenlyase subunit 6/NADH:ubiquinone oxidoreductase subunit I
MRLRLGAMVGDLGRSLFKRPATELYPFVRKPTPARLRGKLHYAASKCIGCQMCARDCPSRAIEIVVLDKARKRYAMRYNVGRCTFCAQCVVSCRYGCLELSSEDWELASSSKAPFSVEYGMDDANKPQGDAR